MIRMAIAAVAASGLLLGAAPAQAGGHVSLSVGVGLPVAGAGYGYGGGYRPGYATYGAPAYYGPPAPVYAPPPVVYAPVPYPVYGSVYGPVYGSGYGSGYYAPRVIYRPARPYDDGRGHGRGDWRR